MSACAMRIGNILFAIRSPLDGVPSALAKVAQLARGLGAEIELFHCVYEPEITRYARFDSDSVAEGVRRVIDQRHRVLEHYAAQLRKEGLKVRKSVRWYHPAHDGIVRQVIVRHSRVRIVEGDLKEALPAFSRTERTQIVACGAVARSYGKRLIIGHTAERLLNRLDCDVLVVKPPGVRSPVARQSIYPLARRSA